MSSDVSNVGVSGVQSVPNKADSPHDYKFNENQKELFRDLSKKMRFVSRCLLWFSMPMSVIGMLAMWNDDRIKAAITLIQAFVYFFISRQTAKTASAFQLIDKPTNNDLAKLRLALRKMRQLYKLQRIVLVLGLLILFLASIYLFLNSPWNPLKSGQ